MFIHYPFQLGSFFFSSYLQEYSSSDRMCGSNYYQKLLSVWRVVWDYAAGFLFESCIEKSIWWYNIEEVERCCYQYQLSWVVFVQLLQRATESYLLLILLHLLPKPHVSFAKYFNFSFLVAVLMGIAWIAL